MNVDWPALLTTLGDGKDLSRAETSAAMTEVLNGDAHPAALGALLMGLKIKGEVVTEVEGFVDAMLDAAEPLAVPDGAIDIVGSGGSHHRRTHALNVSTMACFVAATAGAIVCKHGNVKASSTSGSFDFLSAIGVDIEISPAELAEKIATHGLGFIWARTFHPAMRYAGPVRSALGTPNVFNLLGPLVNPARVRRMVLGASTDRRAELSAEVLIRRSPERVWVVAGAGGLDELSTTGPSKVWEIVGSELNEFTINPEDVGIKRVDMDAIAGGDAETNVGIFRAMTAGDVSTPAADIVVLNAAAGLVMADVASDLGSGVELARDALASGAVADFVAAYTA